MKMIILYSPSAHTNGNVCFYFSDDKNAPADAFLVSQVDQQTAINLPVGSTYSFTAPSGAATVGTLNTVAPSAAFLSTQAWAAYQSLAMTALTESDKTILRCTENSVSVPVAWATYRKALRAIVGAPTGTPGTLPTVPSYPAGT